MASAARPQFNNVERRVPTRATTPARVALSGPRILGALALAGVAVVVMGHVDPAVPPPQPQKAVSASLPAPVMQTVRPAATAPAAPRGSMQAWLVGAASVADQLPAFGAPTGAVESRLVFAAALTIPGVGAFDPEEWPESAPNNFTPYGVKRIAGTAKRLDDLSVSGTSQRSAAAPGFPPRRLASLGPTTAPGMSYGIEEGHPPRTAFYDISARAVYLPNGERLEAHSGLGPLMDDPRSHKVKMRGVTPPNVYRLRMREQLFHGVQAIRLLPEDESAMFRRDGMLAHTYMLGPSGQSNGCVSFKDYPRFLNAFLRGEVDRLVVVAKLDRPPSFYKKNEPAIASVKADRFPSRRLAYAGAESAAEGDGGALAGGFKSWLSRFTSDKPAASRR